MGSEAGTVTWLEDDPPVPGLCADIELGTLVGGATKAEDPEDPGGLFCPEGVVLTVAWAGLETELGPEAIVDGDTIGTVT